MKTFALILFISGLGISNGYTQSNNKALTIQKKLEGRVGSFRTIMASQMGNDVLVPEFRNYPGCGAAVRKVIMNGGSFYSELIDKKSIPFGQAKINSGNYDNVFHHFSASYDFMISFNGSHDTLVKSGAYEEIFYFLRTRVQSPLANWFRVFYIAEEPSTVSYWAPYEIQFNMNNNARLISLSRSLWQKALKEIGTTYPEIKSTCGSTLKSEVNDKYGSVEFHPLSYIIAEESGIDIVDYNQDGHWFQVIGPDAFSGAKAMGETGGNRRDYNWEKPKAAPNKAFLDIPVISVVKAIYGGEDVTTVVADHINGRTDIDYNIDPYYYGKKKEFKDTNFTISWKCLRGSLHSKQVGQTTTVTTDGAITPKLMVACNKK